MDSLNMLSGLAARPAAAVPRPAQDERSSAASPVPEAAVPPSTQQVNDLNKLLQVHQQHLSFSVDESSGVSVLRVIDSESGDVIRQMPSESWLNLARELANSTTGLLRTHA